VKLAHGRRDLRKRHPLVLSRGAVTGSTNVFVALSHDGVTGRGEAAPNGVTGDTADSIESGIEGCRAAIEAAVPATVAEVGELVAGCASPAARAALEVAALDWLGQSHDLPLWRLLGLDGAVRPRTSITVGLGEPEEVAVRAKDVTAAWAPDAVKVKLGSPAGPAVDRAIVSAVADVIPDGTEIWVDANAGWTVTTARDVIPALVAAGVTVIEQPLPPHRPGALPELLELAGPARVYLDESIHRSEDVEVAVGRVHGVNVKLMKSGGITEALRTIAAARAAGLEVMLGCMGETSLAITAAAHLSSLADRIDLDSNLNLEPDPFVGATWYGGRLRLPAGAGLGVSAR
jgi:L-alanine-DL-glutamate epimerase-like enolase superfamily enzyme